MVDLFRVDDITVDGWLHPWQYSIEVLYTLINCSSVLLNAVMMWLMTRDKRLREQTGVVLLFVLCLDDLLVGLTGLVTHSYNIANGGFPNGRVGCAIGAAFIVIFCAEGVQLLALIAFERYYIVVVRKPFTTCQLSGWIAFTWMFATLLACAPLIGWGRFSLMANGTYCCIRWYVRLIRTLLTRFIHRTSINVRCLVCCRSWYWQVGS